MAKNKVLPVLLVGTLTILVPIFQAKPIGKDGPQVRMLEEYGMFEKTENGYLYEGDIMLSEDQAMQMLQRKMFSSGADYWPRNKDNELRINYLIGDDEVDKEIVAKAIAVWEKKTCVQFTKLDSPPKDKSMHFRFISTKSCTSHFGTTWNRDDGGHEVSLSSGCDFHAGIHEIGHAMGFEHEQSRSDAGKYVKVLWNNVEDDRKRWFQPQETSNFGVPYDYFSIMHYGSTDFAKKGFTILTINPLFQLVIDEKKPILSFRDAKVANVAYKCVDDWEKACPELKGKCQNKGYVKQDRMSEACSCVCPDGTTGKHCETVNMSYYDAILKKYFPFTGIITKPGTVSPYNPATKTGEASFTKIIKAPKCKKVVLKVNSLSMFDHYNGECGSESLEIRTDADEIKTGEFLCGGKNWKDRVFESKKNVIILHFRSGYSNGQEFSASFTFEDGTC